MFLLMAVACLLIGLLVMLWSAVVKETDNVTYDENLKVGVLLGTAAIEVLMGDSLRLHLRVCSLLLLYTSLRHRLASWSV